MIHHCYTAYGRPIYMTEFGYSLPQKVVSFTARRRPQYLLHIVIGGIGYFNGETVSAGEAFFIAKEQPHDFSVTVGYEHYWLGFDGDAVPTLLSAFGISHSSHKIFSVKNLKTLLPVIKAAFSKGTDPSDDSYALSILTYVLPCLVKHHAERSSADYVYRAVRFIGYNLHRPLTVEEVADSVHISTKHLCRLFARDLGVSPKRYIITEKLRRASALLRESDMPIGEVARAVGYDSPLAFSSAFRKETGKSPSETRAESRPERRE